MMSLKLHLSDEDAQDFRNFLEDSLDNPFADGHIAEVVLKQIEEEY